MAHAAATAAVNAEAAAALVKVLRQKNNENTAKFFAAGMAGIILISCIFHWTRAAFKHHEVKVGQEVGVLKSPVAISRRVRRLFLRKIPGFVSVGHALIHFGYLGTCILVSFINLDWSILNNWAKRLGWVAVSNLALVIFLSLSLRNTPLAYLTGSSHERLKALHMVAGYSTVFWVLLHAVVYITAWTQSNNLEELLENTQIYGIVAGFSFLIIFATALFLRKMRYEVFYIIHVVFTVLILVMAGMHRSDLSKKTVIIVIFAACIWAADRVLRFLKIFIFSFGNIATITPLPHGSTRVVLRQSPSRGTPGSHCFLWIPGVRAAETHPFTIVSTNPLEFVIASYDGFTKDLHAYALKNPGQSLKASIDGPYGSLPDFTAATKVLFIAGGSGASFSLGVAVDLVHKLGGSRKTMIRVVWITREQESIECYSNQLEELQVSPLVELQVYCTRSSSSLPLEYPISRSPSDSLLEIKKTPIPKSKVSSPAAPKGSLEYDIEKHPEYISSSGLTSLTVKDGRSHIPSLISEILRKAESHDRIVVSACGPDSMMQEARKSVAKSIRAGGPALELYCEQFGF